MPRTTYYPKLQRLDKLSREEHEDLAFDLINAFSLVKTPVESAFLLNDLLTRKEIENLAKRLRIAKLLVAGTKQEEIVEKVHCSFALVSKVKVWLSAGGEGLNRIISRLPKKTVEVKKGEHLVQGMIVKREEISWVEVNKMTGKGRGGYDKVLKRYNKKK